MTPPTLLHVFSTFRVGGPQIRFAQIANEFGADYCHMIVAMDGATDCRSRLRDDLNVTFMPLRPINGGVGSRVVRFRRLLSDINPALLITSNWGSIEWALANMDGRTPHIHLEDGFNPDEAVRQHRRRILARRWLLRRTTVVLPSQTLYGIARDLWRLPEQRLIHIPNGIECTRYGSECYPSITRPLGIADDRPVIGTVAALRPEKHLRRLLNAFAIVLRQRSAQLVIVGDGLERQHLEATVSDLGIAAHVLFTGSQPTPELLLPSFTVFALTSDTEQMPLSILEAMAASRPIVATDVGDVKDMLSEENKPFVVPKDETRLAAAILALLNDSVLRETIGAANAQRVRHVYDQRRMFSTYRALLDEAVRSGARAAHTSCSSAVSLRAKTFRE